MTGDVRDHLTMPSPMSTVSNVASRVPGSRAVGRAVVELVSSLVAAGSDRSHLERARIAARIADEAERISRTEVMAAREDGATWAEVGEAFGVTRQGAHERFRTGPDGLHSRLFRTSPRRGQP